MKNFKKINLFLIIFLISNMFSFSQEIEKEGNKENVIVIHIANRISAPNQKTTAISDDTPCTAIALNNDNCRSAATQSLVGYTTTGATGSIAGTAAVATPACWSAGANERAWFKFTATANQQKISTDVQLSGGGVNNDNQIAVYSSSNGLCSGSLTVIGCQEDVCNCTGAANNQQAELTVTGLTIGQTYWIAVDGDANNDGTFTICTQTAVANDACQTAQAMTQGVIYASSNVGASPYTNTSYSDINFTCGSTENMVFYTFTPTLTTTYYLEQSAQACAGSGTQVMIFKSAYTCSTLPLNPINAASSTYELVCSAASTAYRYFTMSLTAGQTYIIGVDGYAGDECTYNITIGQVLILPIEMVSFEAIPTKNSVNLKWITAAEKNNDFYTVERSSDGVNFSSIGTLKGAGNSSDKLSYTFADTNPLEGISYYRLMETDFDKKEYHYNIISVDYNKVQDLSFELSPNPNDEKMPTYAHLNYVPNSEITILVQDINGIIVYEAKQKLDRNKFEIPNDFTKGVYIVKIINEEKVFTKRMIIK